MANDKLLSPMNGQIGLPQRVQSICMALVPGLNPKPYSGSPLWLGGWDSAFEGSGLQMFEGLRKRASSASGLGQPQAYLPQIIGDFKPKIRYNTDPHIGVPITMRVSV